MGAPEVEKGRVTRGIFICIDLCLDLYVCIYIRRRDPSHLSAVFFLLEAIVMAERYLARRNGW